MERSPGARRVLVLSTDRTLGELARRLLAPLPHAELSCSAQLAALERLLAGCRGAAVLVADARGDLDAALSTVEGLVRRHPSLRPVLVVDSVDAGAALKAMSAGARHCLAAADLEGQLEAAVARQLEALDAEPGPVRGGPGGRGAPSERSAPDLQDGDGDGLTVSVVSTSGGVGASTISVHLAAALVEGSGGLAPGATGAPGARGDGGGGGSGTKARTPGARALVVDLDAHYGGAAKLIGVRPTRSLAGWREGVAEASPAALAEQAGDRLALLASPVSVDPGLRGALELDRPGALVREAARDFGVVVLDAPRLGLEATAALARASSVTLLLFELNVLDVRAARSLYGELVARGAASSRVIGVANRWRRHNPLVSLDDAREALGGQRVVRIANDFEGCLRAMNFAQLLGRVAPRSPVLEDLRELAGALLDRPPRG